MLVGSVSIIAFQNCGMPGQTSDDPSHSLQSFDATLKKQDHSMLDGEVSDNRGVDGCSYQVVLKDGQTERILSPKGGDLKVDPSLLVDGAKIRVHGFFRPDLMDFCMAGEIFEVTSAEIVK